MNEMFFVIETGVLTIPSPWHWRLVCTYTGRNKRSIYKMDTFRW